MERIKVAEEYIKRNKDPDLLYILVDCESFPIKVSHIPWVEPFRMEREDLAYMVVIIDLIILICYLGHIWILHYSIKVDTERHKNLLFETSEFAVMFKKLPGKKNYGSMHELKADFWEHIQSSIQDVEQQIDMFKDSNDNCIKEQQKSCEIVDIYFAMSSYQRLEDLIEIKEVIQQVIKVDKE